MGEERPISSGSIVFDEVAAAIGVEATLKLCRLYPSRRAYIPQNIPSEHEICSKIGREAADKLSSYFHGTHIIFPARIGEVAAVQRLAAEGRLTKSQIAAEVGISERRVYRILASEDDGRQGSLFDTGCHPSAGKSNA